jgi:uncharacterized integral membrane protein (TIGR00697 family)
MTYKKIIQAFNCFIQQVKASFYDESITRGAEPEQSKYKIIESYTGSDGKQMLVVKVCDSTKGVFKIPAEEMVISRKDILSCFDIADLTTIIAIVSADRETEVIYKRKTTYRYDSIIAMIFGVMMVTTNITSTKLVSVFGFTMTASFVTYSLTYLMGDIVTEVYGYKKARQLIWGAVVGNIVMLIFLQLSIYLTSAHFWNNQEQYELILGAVPRIVVASILAYTCGEFINSYALSKFKIHSKDSDLVTRLLCASLVGVSMDSIIFVVVAYAGKMGVYEILMFALVVIIKKLVAILIMMPLSIQAINYLKNIEQVSIVDTNTNYTPFSLDVQYSEYNNLFDKSSV